MSRIFLTLVLAIGFALGLGLQHARIASLKASHAKTMRDIAEKTAAANKAVTAYIQQVQQDAAKVRQQTYERNQQIQAEFADLNNSLATYSEWVRRLSTNQPAKPSNSSSATRPSRPSEQDQATLDLFAQLLDRHTKELAEVGKYAEELRSAGLGCERKYDIQIPSPASADQSFILSPTNSQE